MITKFSSLYAGHIDLGDMGQDATPANERRYANEQLMTVFSKSEAMAKAMDRYIAIIMPILAALPHGVDGAHAAV